VDVTYITVEEGQEDRLEEGEVYCNHQDVILVLSDGVTAYMSNISLAEMVREYQKVGKSREEIAREIAQQAAAHPYSDNCTVLLVPVRQLFEG
jgi:serine/threonine protein phosphatase PrpC